MFSERFVYVQFTSCAHREDDRILKKNPGTEWVNIPDLLNTIEDAVLIPKNAGQVKPLFWHILHMVACVSRGPFIAN